LWTEYVLIGVTVLSSLAAAMEFPRDIGETIPISGPQALTRAEQVATIGAALGREIPLVEITPDEFRAETTRFIPQPIMKMLLDYWGDTLIAPDQARPATTVTGRPGRTLAEWANDRRAEFGG
jgi:uncharacterized protein YbjT (DUF2867 family)